MARSLRLLGAHLQLMVRETLPQALPPYSFQQPVRGLSNAFGVFETYYLTVIIPDSTSNSIAWIGSVQSFLTGLTGVFGGWVIDSGRYRLILLLGTFLEVFGMLVRKKDHS